MIKVRNGLFETNSSSVHSMVILPKEDYNKWKMEGLYVSENWELYTEEEAMKKASRWYEQGDSFEYDEFDKMTKEEQIIQYLKEHELYTFDSWNDSYFLEEDTYDYTSPHGDELVIRCKYGHDY